VGIQADLITNMSLPSTQDPKQKCPYYGFQQTGHESYDQKPALTRTLLHLSAGGFNFLASIAHAKIHKNLIPGV